VFALADRLMDLAQRLVGAAVKAQLADRLRRQLGPRGQSGNRFDAEAAPACPDCGSGAAYRKGFRSRTVEVPRLGAVEFERPYLECRECGCSYAPYDAGAPGQKRYAEEALQRPIEAVLEMSYRRGAQAYPESPSERTLWRMLQGGPPQAEPPQADEPVLDAKAPEIGTCVADATRIPGREAGEQHSLSIAHAVAPDPSGGPGGRPALRREVVAARVGSETRLRAALEPVEVPTLVTDGQMEVSGVATRAGRCRWHLARSVRHLLYHDDVSGERNRTLTEQVRDLAHADFANPVAAKAALTHWAKVCRACAPQAATCVERAASQIAVYARRDRSPGLSPEPSFTVETTAPAEREMRELNRRFENGGQWTRSGAEALLQWHQVYRHDPERWRRWFDRSETV
jgi:hypothetical protein